MVYNYAMELQGNKDKFVMKYISEMVKLAFERKLILLENLYTKEEKDICHVFESNFLSWEKFKEASKLVGQDKEPQGFYISFETKKRNAIPLVSTTEGDKRITCVSDFAKDKYENLKKFKDKKYAYVEEIKELC